MKRHNNDIHGGHRRTLRFLKRACGVACLLLFAACNSNNRLNNTQQTNAVVDSLLEKAYAYEDSSYYDMSRYNRVYRSLSRIYGPPVYRDGMTISWYGGSSKGYVTLSMVNDYGEYYTTMSIGY